MAIKESNKLIAEFMGDYDLYHWGRDPFNEMMKAKYHRDWNHLMPVVKKIKSLEKDYPLLTDSVLTTFIWEPIEVCWGRIVSFIENYNDAKTIQTGK